MGSVARPRLRSCFRQPPDCTVSVRDAVQDADVVVTMVSNADAVLSIMTEREVLVGHEAGRGLDTDVDHWGRGDGTRVAPGRHTTRDRVPAMRRFRAAKAAAENKGSWSFLRQATKLARARQHSHSSMRSLRRHIGSAMSGQGTRMKLLFNAWIAVLDRRGRGSVHTWGCTHDRPRPFRVTGLRWSPGSNVGSG